MILPKIQKLLQLQSNCMERRMEQQTFRHTFLALIFLIKVIGSELRLWHNRRHNLHWQSVCAILSFPVVGEKVQTCFCKYYLGPVQTFLTYWCGGTAGAMQFFCNSRTILLMSGNSERSSWLLIAALASAFTNRKGGIQEMWWGCQRIKGI